jgi:hypothetical protein
MALSTASAYFAGLSTRRLTTNHLTLGNKSVAKTTIILIQMCQVQTRTPWRNSEPECLTLCWFSLLLRPPLCGTDSPSPWFIDDHGRSTCFS